MTDFFKGKEILITGGTGSLGKTLVKLLVKEHRPRGIRIYSRDELKQWQFRQEIEPLRGDCPVAFLVGDVRDAERLRRAMEGVDIVIHTAAQKQVPSSEENPQEAIKTNVHGSENVMNAALDCLVERVMYVNTDKAAKPTTLYGATKMCAERLFIHGNVYAGSRGTKFSACRYGNVLGSRGSVAHVFREQALAGKPLSITHKGMTRFWITIPEVARFILARLADMQGGEVFVPKMKSMGIYDMAVAMGERRRCECGVEGQGNALCPWCDGTLPAERILPEFKVTGIRQGEKLHEILFADEEFCYDRPDHYVVTYQHRQEFGTAQHFELRSDRNPAGELISGELLAMLAETGL